jgi:hypothetical protein
MQNRYMLDGGIPTFYGPLRQLCLVVYGVEVVSQVVVGPAQKSKLGSQDLDL